MSQKRAAQSSPEPRAHQAARTDSFDDCLVTRPESCDCRCHYHRFLIECDPESLIVPFPMPESKRQFILSTGKAKRRSETSSLRRIDSLPFERKKTAQSLAVARLSRFLELLDMFCNAPWCSAYHKPNHLMLQRLTYSHLPLIVGRDNMCAHPPMVQGAIAYTVTGRAVRRRSRDSSAATPR